MVIYLKFWAQINDKRCIINIFYDVRKFPFNTEIYVKIIKLTKYY